MQGYDHNMKKIFVLAILVSLSLVFATTVSAATLSISPASQSVKVGEIFSVAVTLDTQNELVDGVDLVYLNYDHTLLEVQDASTTVAGIQINPGDLLPSTQANIVDSSLGRITFSQLASAGGNYNSVGTLASISFKAIAAGNANVTFDYTASSTIDSNVASAGRDILSGVSNGSFTISNPAPSVPVIPAPSGGGGGIGGGGGGGGSVNNVSGNVGSTASNVVVATTSASTTQSITKVPLKITRWLVIGSTGSDVLQLQKALNQNGYVVASTGQGSPNNESTYFGPTTATALGRFQCLKLQVCSGGPYTTGYGATGPRTRQALSQLFVISTSTYIISASSTTPNVAGCPIGIICTPIVVANCPVGFTCRPITTQAFASTSVTFPITNVGISTFTRSLTLGSTGLDVKNLQIFLNSKGFIVSFTGVGSKGFETSYFGPATQKAVIKFQIANGITPAVGFFGPLTMKAVNRLIK
jgi:peptidoglycan hydrolase-like protein with peptidoglycan-binding domain